MNDTMHRFTAYRRAELCDLLPGTYLGVEVSPHERIGEGVMFTDGTVAYHPAGDRGTRTVFGDWEACWRAIGWPEGVWLDWQDDIPPQVCPLDMQALEEVEAVEHGRTRYVHVDGTEHTGLIEGPPSAWARQLLHDLYPWANLHQINDAAIAEATDRDFRRLREGNWPPVERGVVRPTTNERGADPFWRPFSDLPANLHYPPACTTRQPVSTPDMTVPPIPPPGLHIVDDDTMTDEQE